MAYDSYPAGMSRADLIHVGEITDPAITALERDYDDWRDEKIIEAWDDICSNLSIEIDDCNPLYKDEALREIIIAEHERQFPSQWDEEAFLEEWEEE